MRMNVFEGARRIALLLATIATIVVVVMAATYDPYISINYRLYQPGTPLLRSYETCPREAGQHFFSARTADKDSVGVNLCLMTMSFGKDGEHLVPYKTDRGFVWGAESYSSEVRAYAENVEKGFQFPANDKKWIESEIAKRYRENWHSLLKGLAIGLVVFWAFVWAIGWVVRGFAGIPRGKDRRQDT